MNKRIILINQATGPLFIDMANEYVKKYIDVTLITGKVMPTYAELDPKINVVFKKKYNNLKNSSRVYTWLVFFFQSLFYILFRRKIDKVLFVSNPPMLPFIGVFLSSIKKFKYDVLVYDIYPDALLNFGYVTEKSIIYRFWERMNEKTYKYANRIFTISEFMKKVISRRAKEKEIEVVYPWVDTSFIVPKNKSENWFIEKHNLLDKKVVLYSGNMGITHDLMVVLQAAKVLLEKKDERFQFLFIGDGVQLKDLMSFKKDNLLENVSFLPYQDADVLPFSFTSADFGIVSLGTGAEGLSVPSKMFYLLAAGCSVISISDKGSEIEYLVNKNDLGISIEPGKVNDLVNFLVSTNEAELIKAKTNSRNLSYSFTLKNAKKFL
jgi:glycosyltransferase involved in cell wall biosynthesis